MTLTRFEEKFKCCASLCHRHALPATCACGLRSRDLVYGSVHLDDIMGDHNSASKIGCNRVQSVRMTHVRVVQVGRGFNPRNAEVGRIFEHGVGTKSKGINERGAERRSPGAATPTPLRICPPQSLNPFPLGPLRASSPRCPFVAL